MSTAPLSRGHRVAAGPQVQLCGEVTARASTIETVTDNADLLGNVVADCSHIARVGPRGTALRPAGDVAKSALEPRPST